MSCAWTKAWAKGLGQRLGPKAWAKDGTAIAAMTSIAEIMARSNLRREYSRINQAARKLPI
jgi:hypothetical protein